MTLEERLRQDADELRDSFGAETNRSYDLRTAADVIAEMRAALEEIIPTSQPVFLTAGPYSEWEAKVKRARAVLAKAKGGGDGPDA